MEINSRHLPIKVLCRFWSQLGRRRKAYMFGSQVLIITCTHLVQTHFQVDTRNFGLDIYVYIGGVHKTPRSFPHLLSGRLRAPTVITLGWLVK